MCVILSMTWLLSAIILQFVPFIFLLHLNKTRDGDTLLKCLCRLLNVTVCIFWRCRISPRASVDFSRFILTNFRVLVAGDLSHAQNYTGSDRRTSRTRVTKSFFERFRFVRVNRLPNAHMQ